MNHDAEVAGRESPPTDPIRESSTRETAEPEGSGSPSTGARRRRRRGGRGRGGGQRAARTTAGATGAAADQDAAPRSGGPTESGSEKSFRSRWENDLGTARSELGGSSWIAPSASRARSCTVLSSEAKTARPGS